MKVCTKCKIEKPRSEFRPNKAAGKNAIQSQCRPCEKEYQRVNAANKYKENPEKFRDIARKDYRKRLSSKHETYEYAENLYGFVPVPGHDGVFIDCMGTVVNTNRYLKPRFVKSYLAKNGYLVVSLNNKREYLHRVLGMAFLNNPLNKKTINHKNGIKTDNRLENIEWATYSENNTHAYRVLGKKGRSIQC